MNFINQQRVKQTFKSIYSGGKIAHAYIFFGKEGVGKDAAALEFAKLLNCTNVQNNEPCNTCESCKKISAFKSTNVHFITALPAGKGDLQSGNNPLMILEKGDYETYKTEISYKAEDPYYKLTIPKANSIRIDSIRYLKHLLYTTGDEGKIKVFIISKADTMTDESANALLKALEEPPGDSVIILTTSRMNSLPQTIIGRCQKIHFESLSVNDIKKYIVRKYNLSEYEAEFYAELADGSITLANEIAGSTYIDMRESMINFLAGILTERGLALSTEIEKLAAKKDKVKLKQFLVLMMAWFRDAVYMKAESKEYIVNKDKEDRLARFAERYEFSVLKISRFIENSIRDLEGNLYPEIVLRNLASELSREIKLSDY